MLRIVKGTGSADRIQIFWQKMKIVDAAGLAFFRSFSDFPLALLPVNANTSYLANLI